MPVNIKEISISLAGSFWLDVTNDIRIGSAENVVKYVNQEKLIVKNEQSFNDCDKFWYNQTEDGKDEAKQRLIKDANSLMAIHSATQITSVSTDSSQNQNGGDYDEWDDIHYFVVQVPDGSDGQTKLIDFKFAESGTSFEGGCTTFGRYESIKETVPVVALINGKRLYLKDSQGRDLYFRSDSYSNVQEPNYVAFTI